jgi:hypothetical protein
VLSNIDETCLVHYLNHRKIINVITVDGDRELVGGNCDVNILTVVTKFYDDVQNLIRNGVNIEHLDSSDFLNNKKCIMQNLKYFNVSDLFLKSIAYQKLGKIYHSENSKNKITSEEFLLLNALEVCNPRSFYKKHETNIFSLNNRTNDEQAICFLNYLNKNSKEPYDFHEKIETTAEAGDSGAMCDTIIKKFVTNYNKFLHRVRSIPMFDLSPNEVIKCRALDDKSLIDNIMLLTIFDRLNLSLQQKEIEDSRFYEIARKTAKSFFHCIFLYN